MPKRTGKLIVRLLAFAVLVSISLFLFNTRISPTVRNIAAAKANNLANNIVDAAVAKVLEEENVTYDMLVTLNRDSNGKVCSLTTDIVLINILKGKITDGVEDMLSSLEPQVISIPLGTLIGFDTTAGYGPKIHINLQLEGFANAEIMNNFDAAGINQTRHQLLFNILTNVYIILPGCTRCATLDNYVCIAETIIVGVVPETFASFDEKITQK